MYHTLAKGSNNPKYLVDHELGHSIQHKFGLDGNSNDKDIEVLWEKFRKDAQADRLVSKYAKASKSEFISECWASFRNTDDCNFTAKDLCNILERMYLR